MALGTVDIEKMRDAIGNHLISGPEEMMFWIVQEVPLDCSSIVACTRADVTGCLGARKPLKRHASVFTGFVFYFHGDPLFGIEGDGFRGGDIEKGGIEHIRIFSQKVTTFCGEYIRSVAAWVVESIRVPSG